MTPQPTGRLVRRDDGVYVVFDRIFAAPIEDVWASITRKDRLQQWIGTWKGQPSTGAITFHMTAEESLQDNADKSVTWQDVAILTCEPPHRFEADIDPGENSQRLFCHLTEAAAHTALTFGQRLTEPKKQADLGVGWDYYLDRLVATRANQPLPEWDDYYPILLTHYQDLATEFGS